MMQDLRRQSGDGEASQRPATAGSSYITPRAGEKMGADGVSGSQMPEQSWRKLEPQWGWGNHLSGAETNTGSWRCHLKQRGRRSILPFSPLCPGSLLLPWHFLLAKPVGKCGSLQSKRGNGPERKPAGHQHCGLSEVLRFCI